MSQNCPHGESVPSNRPNKPPGISSHNVEVNFDGIDNYDDVGRLAETTEIPVASIRIRSDEEDGFGTALSRMSGLISLRTMTLLEQMQPYPFDESPIEGRRFLVYQFEEDQYVIMDQELCDDEYINSELLIQEDFNLPEWYAIQHA